MDSQGCGRLFQSVRTQNLEHLLVLCDAQRAEQYEGLWKGFINRTTGPPSTKQLTLHSLHGEKHLVWALKRLPTLEAIKIYTNCRSRCQLWDELEREPPIRRPWLCPNLTSIELERVGGPMPDFKTLVYPRVRDVPTEIPRTKRYEKLMPPKPLQRLIVGGVDMVDKWTDTE